MQRSLRRILYRNNVLKPIYSDLAIQVSSQAHKLLLKKIVPNASMRIIARGFCKENENLKETINKVKREYEKGKDASGNENEIPRDEEAKQDGAEPSPIRKVFSFLRTTYENISTNISEAFGDLLGENKRSYIKKQVTQADSFRGPKKDDDDNPEDSYDGPTSLVAVKEAKSPWEQMRDRMQNSEFVREILKNAKKMSDAAATTDIGKKAKEVTDGVKDRIEDMRNVWETSQNPLIYTISGVWENLTAETEEAITVTNIKKLDPGFLKEAWAEEVRVSLVEPLIKAHLAGNIKNWKEYLGEGVYEKLTADIRARKTDGYEFDSNVLAVDENVILMKMHDNTPTIVTVFMVQLINCIRNRNGEIVEVRLRLQLLHPPL